MAQGRKLLGGWGAITATLVALLVVAGTSFGVLVLAEPDDSEALQTRAAAGVPRGSDKTAETPPPAEPKAQDPKAEQPEAHDPKAEQPKAGKPPAPKPPQPLLEQGDRGVDVRELQSRLKQLEWYFPDVTGRYDDTTVVAVRGFQRKRGFDATGAVDERTWRRVVSMSRMPTDDEMHNRLTPGPTILGPGDTGLEVRELQARLIQIAWMSGDVTDYYGETTTAAVAGFQTKRAIPSTGEVDQRTLDRLLAMTTEPTGDELFNREPEPEPAPVAAGAPLDPRCLTGRVMCVDKSSNSLRWVVDGDVQMTVDVRFGSDELPTDEGEFAVSYKSIDHVSSLYDTPMPYAMFFSGGQAVHYSPDFAANGYNGASHGCVNVRDYGAIQSLFDQVYVGDKVVVYWS